MNNPHNFEAFCRHCKRSEWFDRQDEQGKIECGVCHRTLVSWSPMVGFKIESHTNLRGNPVNRDWAINLSNPDSVGIVFAGDHIHAESLMINAATLF
jgi:hypothetical protein